MARARKLTRRRERAAEGAFLIEGKQNVLAALEGSARIEDLLVEAGTDPDLLRKAAEAGIEPLEVSTAVMKAISTTTTPQGVVAVASMPPGSLDDLPADADLVVVLAEVRDPGNAGTLVRSAHAAGADAVVFTTRSVDPFGPKTVRASAGALFGVAIARDVDPVDAAEALHSRGFTLFGADAAAKVSVFDRDLTGKVALFLGNEAWGLPDDMVPLLDEQVSIPMPGPVESLNVGVAGSLLLFEAVRQRQGPS